MVARVVPVTIRDGVAPERAAPFADALSGLRTLGDVLAWLRGRTPPRAVTEIVTQDEYTHDVVVGWDDALWLAFDTT